MGSAKPVTRRPKRRAKYGQESWYATTGRSRSGAAAATQRAIAANVDYLGAASLVVACERDVALPDVDLTRPRTPRDPERFAALAAELGLGGAADRILAALAG